MYKIYLKRSIKIFLISLILGKIIDIFFIYLEEIIHKKLNNNFIENKIVIFLLILLQFFSLVSIVYFLHSLTSNQFSHQLQIYSPYVLLSSFILTMQHNLFKNINKLVNIKE